jgi:hypothetical protein
MAFSKTMLCHYADYHILFIIMLNVIMLNVIMLSVMAPRQPMKARKGMALSLSRAFGRKLRQRK